MKKLLLIALLIIGCDNPTKSDNDNLFGLWIYTQGYEELRLTFTQDGIFEFERLLNSVTTTSTSGTYIIENSQINVSDSSCDPFVGQYNYSIINDIISFSKLQDDCYGRASSMTHSFTKSI